MKTKDEISDWLNLCLEALLEIENMMVVEGLLGNEDKIALLIRNATMNKPNH